MNIEELITHTNIIIEEGLDSEDDIQLILKKWKTAYEKEKEENMSYYYHIQGLEDDIRMHYISTYKIEKEIKKIKDSNTYGCEEWNDRDVVELLENLISKEE